MLHTLRFSLQNAVYFTMLPFLVHVLFTFYIQIVLKFKVSKSVHYRTIQINYQPDATTVVRCSWSGRLARPRTQHDYPHDTKVKPEAATAVTGLLMMSGKTPETC
jgi:hypothetical protein